MSAAVISLPTTPAVQGVCFDAIAGELHHDGGVRYLSRLHTDLLMILMAARGEMVPAELVNALTRTNAPYTDPAGRRRQLIHNLRERIRDLGLDIEHRPGFGYRLRGEIHLRAMENRAVSARPFRATGEPLPPKPPKMPAPPPANMPPRIRKPSHLARAEVKP